jgi:hypothetical protein
MAEITGFGLAMVLRWSLESITLIQGDRRDEEAYREFQSEAVKFAFVENWGQRAWLSFLAVTVDLSACPHGHAGSAHIREQYRLSLGSAVYPERLPLRAVEGVVRG